MRGRVEMRLYFLPGPWLATLNQKALQCVRRSWNITFSRSFLHFWSCSFLLRLFALCNSWMEVNNVVGARAGVPMRARTHTHPDTGSVGFM